MASNPNDVQLESDVRPFPCFRVLNASLDATKSRKLSKISESYEGKCGGLLGSAAAWGPSFYRLDRSSLYRGLNPEAQSDLLSLCGRAILEEAQLIEIAGTTYTAKMSLLSETLDERLLYSYFSADEARHLGLITGLAGPLRENSLPNGGFLSFLDEIIRDETPMTLVLLIQVLLEGWGIRYYGSLERAAQVPDVARVFRSILVDEGRHHGSGLILFNEDALTRTEFQRALERVWAFLEMVRLGPVGLVAHLGTTLGGLSSRDVLDFLEEIDFQEKVEADLKLLKGLLTSVRAFRILDALSEKQVFAVPSLKECHGKITAALGIPS